VLGKCKLPTMYQAEGIDAQERTVNMGPFVPQKHAFFGIINHKYYFSSGIALIVW
jgi:hypothetical protein